MLGHCLQRRRRRFRSAVSCNADCCIADHPDAREILHGAACDCQERMFLSLRRQQAPNCFEDSGFVFGSECLFDPYLNTLLYFRSNLFTIVFCRQ